MKHFDKDSLHRLVKQAIDSGTASTVDEAEAMFRGYRVGISITAAEAATSHGQLALLTSVALARRTFLGGALVTGPLDVRLVLPLPLGATLAEAVVALGGEHVDHMDSKVPEIAIGGPRRPRAREFEIRAVASGWRGGIVPVDADDAFQAGGPTMPLAATLAAALAINEAFLHVRDEMPAAGRRSVGMSLWRPEATQDWRSDDGAPELELLPSRLWLLGLGHLGQGYLWALSALPYAAGDLELVLHDIDTITESTESTSVLTDRSMVGTKKTRAMASWAEARGFSTSLYERRFDASWRRQSAEPAVLLCGLDNSEGRRALDAAGFDLVVEAGLGRGFRDFRTMRLHTFPSTRRTADIWAAPSDLEDLSDRPAYTHLAAAGALDRCGLTLLAGTAVGAAFVGCVAAALACSEILRVLHGGSVAALIDLDLQCIEHRALVPQSNDFGAINPGFVRAARQGPFG